ncbi:hypothetical protein LguiB_027080 [Lonicera macranthoides]
MYMVVGLTSSGRGAWRRALACGGREEDAIRRWVRGEGGPVAVAERGTVVGVRAMLVSNPLPKPALLKAKKPAPLWTVLQLLQTCLPSAFDCYGPNEVLSFFSSVQPILMERKGYSEGFSVGLKDFFIAKELQENIQMSIQDVFPLLHHLRSSYNALVELQLENHLKLVKMPATNFIMKSSSQQIGFLSVQMSDKGKLYSSSTYRTAEFSFVRSCLFHGLDPYQEMVHSFNSREVMVRSSRGITKLETLFKNLINIK